MNAPCYREACWVNRQSEGGDEDGAGVTGDRLTWILAGSRSLTLH